MNAEQKLKHHILMKCPDIVAHLLDNRTELTAESIDEVYDSFRHDDCFSDMIYESIMEIRGGEVETGLPCDYSRHYESKAVAAKMLDGAWIGWTYWYGGGKHGEPDAVEWMDYAYLLDCKEEEKLVVVKTFSFPTDSNE